MHLLDIVRPRRDRAAMRLSARDYRVKPNQTVALRDWPTRGPSLCDSKDEYRKRSGEQVEELSALQDLFYANRSYSLLLVFQAMDAAGKDSAIKHVMSGVNPQGCQVHSFKHPSRDELEHDFLWRSTQHLPPRGMIGIFNRSYYEEVLIVRVHPEILAGQNLPLALSQRKTIWPDRHRSIVDLESHLSRSGTKVIKFFLHLSKNEQRKRFLKRIDDDDKNWKFNPADMKERQFWKQYMRAYESCLGATSTAQAPWYVVPADDKSDAHLIVSEIILDTMRGLELTYPASTRARRKELAAIRKTL